MEDIKQLANYNLSNVDCICCHEEIRSGFYNQCTDCAEYLCDNCLSEEQPLGDVAQAKLKCEICLKTVCHNCLMFCFKCANRNYNLRHSL